jgi:hypothetical protein
MRNLEIKVRNLRENWKARALAAEKKLKSLNIEGGSEEKKQNVNPRKTT